MNEVKDMAALERERLDNCHKVMRQEPVDRILNKSFAVTWKYIDAGLKLSEALNDLDKIEQAQYLHQERYGFDLFNETGTRNAFRVNTAMGTPGYFYDDEAYTISVPETEYVSAEEFAKFPENPKKFIWENLMPKRYPEFFEDHDLSRVENALKEQQDYFAMGARVNKGLKEKYGIPVMQGAGVPASPVEWIINRLRGIKGFSIDMRRNAALLDSAVDAFYETWYMPAYNAMMSLPNGYNEDVCFDTGIALLLHSILSVQQFDKYYWPYFKKTLDGLTEKGKSINIFMQGTGDRIYDHFTEYPKGILMFSLDNDYPGEVRKIVPNASLSGGIPCTLLNYGTKEEVINRAKEVIDSVDGIGFILSEDKMMTYKNDGNPENVKALCDFMHEQHC